VANISIVNASSARLAVFIMGATRNPIVLLHGGPGVPDDLAGIAEILARNHLAI
jgi:pimeloyl-ACP methyl ester carboxylesterase